MTAHPYHHKLARTLERMGGVYTVSDILAAIAENRMQSPSSSATAGRSLRSSTYPRARMLEILVVLGDIEECRRLHDRVLQYAGTMTFR